MPFINLLEYKIISGKVHQWDKQESKWIPIIQEKNESTDKNIHEQDYERAMQGI